MPVKKFLAFLLIVTLAMLPLAVSAHRASADQLDDINKQLSQLSDELNKSVAATQPLQSQLDNEQKQIAAIKGQIAGIESDISMKKKQIDDGYKNLAQKETIISHTIRDFYVKSYYDNPLLTLFSEASMSDMTQTLAYQHAQTEQDKSIITNIALTISDLETKKAQLQQERTALAATKTKLDAESATLDKVVAGAKGYQSQLSNQISVLTVQQQQFIAQKQGSLSIPTSAYTTSGGCSSDLKNGKDPGFSQKFGLFTYGVPNRVGLNQYGAKGRAATQDAMTILHAYYNFDAGTSSNPNIHVVGTNNYGQNIDMTLPLEDYLKHIYEMPASWPSEALKAQVIAARSYVLAYTNNGQKAICPSDHCQEFKNELNAQPWIDAVNATNGQIMTNGGQPITAWFSSTHGGYVHSSGGDIGGAAWTKNAKDTTDDNINSFSDLQAKAYDKDSPWFYCDWGSHYNGTAWLKPEELADIVNTILLARADSGTRNHLYQTDKANPTGTDTWDENRVKQELKNKGITAFNSISNATVDADFGSGITTQVHISGDGGSQSFGGSEFMGYFNLRAPANINIVGPLYNIER